MTDWVIYRKGRRIRKMRPSEIPELLRDGIQIGATEKNGEVVFYDEKYDEELAKKAKREVRKRGKRTKIS